MSLDDPLCIELDPSSGPPGATVSLEIVPTPCESVDGATIFLFEDFEGGVQEGAALREASDGRAAFTVPMIPAGLYLLAVDCPPASTPTRLESTFTVLPDTSTASAEGSAPWWGLLAVAGLVGALAALRRVRPAARDRS